MTSAARTEYREELLARVPRGYSPFLHLVIPSVLALGAIDTAVALLRDVRWWEVALVPVLAAVLSAFEWHAHREVLHRHLRPLGALYRHHMQHHILFVKGELAMRDPRELRMVLLPVVAILALFAVVLPVALLLHLAGQRNLALIWTATSVGYATVYEWLHLGWHLPEHSLAAQLPVLRTLRRLHELHHDPKLMHRYNLNVTVPLWDWLNGTLRTGVDHPSNLPPSRSF
ncbi:MAG TPA: sterol desaturase family protein [Anaeromyxobacteraceae bacterium]|nr:sterol desaturase family protein [Anaeromyxobacteraceae bacterium]